MRLSSHGDVVLSPLFIIFNCLCTNDTNIHVHPAVDLPWWRDSEKYCIGTLSEKTQKIWICNLLSKEEVLLEVPQEETLLEIQDR